MSITAHDTGFTRELIPAGNYLARCIGMIEIGTVADMFQGKQITSKKVRISWELPTELKVFNPEKGEQPYTVSKEYTLSLNPKATLRKDLASWRSKDFTPQEAKAFDITKLVGKECMINIIHKNGVNDPSKVYEVIAGITPIPKGTKCPPAINNTLILSFDAWDKEKFDSLPDFIRNRIMSSAEFQKILRPDETNIPDASEVIEPLDDLPF